MLEDELEAVFAICRQRGYKVMCQDANPDAVKSGLRLKAHSVEHGYRRLANFSIDRDYDHKANYP